MTDSGNFDWHADDTKDLIVVRRQDAVAVYENVSGDVTIRQMQDWPHEEADTLIVIPRDRVLDTARAMLRAIGMEDEPQALLPRPRGADRNGRDASRDG
jgi:hypothetical protein